jgi:hypothetical protein
LKFTVSMRPGDARPYFDVLDRDETAGVFVPFGDHLFAAAAQPVTGGGGGADAATGLLSLQLASAWGHEHQRPRKVKPAGS